MRDTDSRKIRFAVVGCGNIGARHLQHIYANPGAKLAALCDSDESVCAKYSSQYGVPGFTDYDRLLEDSDVDVVSVCTPHALHAPMAIQAVNSGRHVLVEKPMALTVSDALQMKRAAAAKGQHLMMVWQNRYNVPIKLTYDALREGRLGRIFMAHCSVLWNRPQSYYDSSPWRGNSHLEGGALFTQCSHFIDLMIHFFGEIECVNSIGDTKNHDIEVEDCGTAMLRFYSGVLGSLSYTTCVHNKNYEGSITIVGEKGTIKIGGEYLNRIDFWDVQSYPLPRNLQFTDKPNKYSSYSGSASNHDKVIADVVATLTGRVPRTPGWDDGHRVVKAIQMIYRSQANDGAVVTDQAFEAEEQSPVLAFGAAHA
jgi:UDP-N-acetyl-2-amino-2-deoxyglucuronate dehydrogenase